MLKLRSYQVDAIDAVLDDTAHGVQRPAVVLPTGMGKTVIFAAMVKQLLDERDSDGERTVWIIVHRDELVRQTLDKLRMIAPELPAGVFQGARREQDRRVVVASVATLGRAGNLTDVPVRRGTRIIVDECHHASANSYVAVLRHFGCFDPDSGNWAVGFTATLDRSDNTPLGALYDRSTGDLIRPAIWQKVSYYKDTLYGIVNGHLVDVRGMAVEVDGFDLTSVARSHGDFQEGSLEDALLDSGAFEATATAYKEHAGDRQGVAFWPTVATAELGAKEFTAAGIPTEVITGTTPTEVRQDAYRRIRTGETQVLSNCMVLTEGFDEPRLSCAVIGRPTQSEPLYVQMVGRVLRPCLGKRDALVLDVAGASTRLSLATLANLADGTVNINPGESLAEALEREATEQRKSGKKAKIDGIDVVDIDLFKNSKQVWLTSTGGKWFVPTKQGYVFISQDLRRPGEDDAWMVGKTATQYARKGLTAHRWNPADTESFPRAQSWGWLRVGLTMELAMAVAEQVATELDPSVSDRTASWRKRRDKPSEAQVSLCVGRGIDVPTNATKNDVSDLLSVYYASRLLDVQ